jgi:sodium-independent sulfate anion transporter 11
VILAEAHHLRIRVDIGWLTGDLIAGFTVGMVMVPQTMSYAVVSLSCADPLRLLELRHLCQIATLPPEYGLYSAFVGTMIYCVRPRLNVSWFHT